MKKTLFIAIIIALVLIVGCSSNKKVTRVGVDQTIDLSGRWNDVDSRLVSEEIVKDVVSQNWLMNFVAERSDKPVVTVGTIRNLTSEHIQTETFIKDIQRELINSGKVRFVAGKNERDEIRQERLEQQSFASEETAKRLAEEIGADFVLQGSIKSITDAADGERVIFYQVNLQLVNTESNETVWIGEKKHKKFISKNKVKL
ncbi:penicillin-binding protein activator LpoB [bacterium]|nr:penicillin-binding protein activator LpoB [bacterium]